MANFEEKLKGFVKFAEDAYNSDLEFRKATNIKFLSTASDAADFSEVTNQIIARFLNNKNRLKKMTPTQLFAIAYAYPDPRLAQAILELLESEAKNHYQLIAVELKRRKLDKLPRTYAEAVQIAKEDPVLSEQLARELNLESDSEAYKKWCESASVGLEVIRERYKDNIVLVDYVGEIQGADQIRHKSTKELLDDYVVKQKATNSETACRNLYPILGSRQDTAQVILSDKTYVELVSAAAFDRNKPEIRRPLQNNIALHFRDFPTQYSADLCVKTLSAEFLEDALNPSIFDFFNKLTWDIPLLSEHVTASAIVDRIISGKDSSGKPELDRDLLDTFLANRWLVKSYWEKATEEDWVNLLSFIHDIPEAGKNKYYKSTFNRCVEACGREKANQIYKQVQAKLKSDNSAENPAPPPTPVRTHVEEQTEVIEDLREVLTPGKNKAIDQSRQLKALSEATEEEHEQAAEAPPKQEPKEEPVWEFGHVDLGGVVQDEQDDSSDDELDEPYLPDNLTRIMRGEVVDLENLTYAELKRLSVRLFSELNYLRREAVKYLYETQIEHKEYFTSKIEKIAPQLERVDEVIRKCEEAAVQQQDLSGLEQLNSEKQQHSGLNRLAAEDSKRDAAPLSGLERIKSQHSGIDALAAGENVDDAHLSGLAALGDKEDPHSGVAALNLESHSGVARLQSRHSGLGALDPTGQQQLSGIDRMRSPVLSGLARLESPQHHKKWATPTEDELSAYEKASPSSPSTPLLEKFQSDAALVNDLRKNAVDRQQQKQQTSAVAKILATTGAPVKTIHDSPGVPPSAVKPAPSPELRSKHASGRTSPKNLSNRFEKQFQAEVESETPPPPRP